MKDYLQTAAQFLDKAQSEFARGSHLKHAATTARLLGEVYQLQAEYEALFEGGHPLKESGVRPPTPQETVVAGQAVAQVLAPAVPRYDPVPERGKEAIEQPASYRGPWTVPTEAKHEGPKRPAGDCIVGYGHFLSAKYVMEIFGNGEAWFYVVDEKAKGPAVPNKIGTWTVMDKKLSFQGFEKIMALESIIADLTPKLVGVQAPNATLAKQEQAQAERTSIFAASLKAQGIDG